MPDGRSIVIHGHFYQPPREDPWLGYVEAEPTAAPFHDWNQRINHECYRAVVAARLPGAEGRIGRIVNTLDFISYDLGPTLATWMEHEAPETYAAFLESDRVSRARLGHGNAIATPYHHVILPLCTRRDKVTEVRWGMRDFTRRFDREPDGMWLPEAAVDLETLDVLAEEGIRFTIVGPEQVEQIPAGGLPGLHRTSGGKSIALFVYDGPLAHDVAFGPLMRDASLWSERLLGD
jgi:alpha-amylase/alpha-mannosidase (GH57 family)